jgi:hypothetical protein
VSDGALTATANVSGTVTPVNDAPAASDDTFTLAEDGSVTIDVLTNDSDLDGDTLTITEVDGQAITDGGAAVAVTNGSVALVAGKLVFIPSPDFNGPASFSYTVSDGADTAVGVVSGFVTPVYDAPPPPSIDPSPLEPAVEEAPQPLRPAEERQRGDVLTSVVSLPVQPNPVPLKPVSPEIHVLNAVNRSRIEAALLADGVTIEQGDRVLMSEAISQVPENMLLLQNDEDALTLDMESGWEHQSVKPAVYVQRAVRHEALTSDHGLFVQRVVRASQLESRVDDMRIAELSGKLGDMTEWSAEAVTSAVLRSPYSSEPSEPRINPAEQTQGPTLAPQEDEPSGRDLPGEDSIDSEPVAPETDLEAKPKSAAKGFRSQLQAFALHRSKSILAFSVPSP